jgi:L-histidine Nalpha-methyltransferase
MMGNPARKTQHIAPPHDDALAADVVAGLSAARKSLPAKYFYDAEGSRLFDLICDLPEYYPTCTETGILADHAGHIAKLAGREVALVEFGSGSSAKVRLLLDALEDAAAYVPIDISAEHMMDASAALRADYPGLDILPVAGDFTRPIALPASIEGKRRVGFFPGSTIGNFTREEAGAFMTGAAETLGPEALFVVGVDLRKDRATLEAAYNDAQGVTARFNLNMLTRLNRELSGGFDLSAFRHRAFYDEDLGRIEMHLESRRRQTVTVAGHSFVFAEGETIHTENSYKYAPEEFERLAADAGWRRRDLLTDKHALFAVFCLERA